MQKVNLTPTFYIGSDPRLILRPFLLGCEGVLFRFLKLLETSTRFVCSSKNDTQFLNSLFFFYTKASPTIFSLFSLFCSHSSITMFIKSRVGSSGMIQTRCTIFPPAIWYIFIDSKLESLSLWRDGNPRDLILGKKAIYTYFPSTWWGVVDRDFSRLPLNSYLVKLSYDYLRIAESIIDKQ